MQFFDETNDPDDVLACLTHRDVLRLSDEWSDRSLLFADSDDGRVFY